MASRSGASAQQQPGQPQNGAWPTMQKAWHTYNKYVGPNPHQLPNNRGRPTTPASTTRRVSPNVGLDYGFEGSVNFTVEIVNAEEKNKDTKPKAASSAGLPSWTTTAAGNGSNGGTSKGKGNGKN